MNEMGQLPADDSQRQSIQRILIFDDHPDSLRLVFGNGASAPADPEVEVSKEWWEPIWDWTPLLAVMVLLLLSLFLK